MTLEMQITKLSQEEEKLNSPILIKEIEFTFQNLRTKKTIFPAVFSEEVHQMFKRKKKATLHKLFHTPEKRILPNSFYETSITLMSKPNRFQSYHKTMTSMSHEHKCKNDPYLADQI